MVSQGVLNDFPVESFSKNSLSTGRLKEVTQYFSFLGHTPERSEGTKENLLLKINNLYMCWTSASFMLFKN